MQQPSRAFSVFQEFGHWNRDPEFPGGSGCQPPLARGGLLHLASLLVSAQRVTEAGAKHAPLQVSPCPP